MSRAKGPPPRCGLHLPKGPCIRPPGHEGPHLQPPSNFHGPAPQAFQPSLPIKGDCEDE